MKTKIEKSKLLKYLLIGFGIYTLGYVLVSALRSYYNLGYGFQFLGIVMMIPSAWQLCKWKFDSVYLRSVYSIYLFWLAVVLLRGITFDFELIKMQIFSAWFGVFIYFTPIFLLIPRNLFFYRQIFKLVLIFSLVGISLELVFFNDIMGVYYVQDRNLGRSLLEVIAKTLCVPAGFILLTYNYHSNKKLILSLACLALTIICAIGGARRGLILMASLPLTISYLLYLLQSKGVKRAVLMTATVGSAIFINTYSVEYFNKGSLFLYLNKKAVEDTRSGVEVRFIKDFSLSDWMFGRGMLGTYFCPEVPDPFFNRGQRMVIETDFLQIILKGGILSLLLLLLILVPAAYLGLFRSKNSLAKAAGIWIFLGLINMYPSYVNTFTLNYVLIWISVGICYSGSIRNLPDPVLKSYFALK